MARDEVRRTACCCQRARVSPSPDENSESVSGWRQCWRRFVTPSPYWVLPVLLSHGLMAGSGAVFQRVAVDFYGNNAEWYFNICGSCTGVVHIVSSPIVGALADRYGRKTVLLWQGVMMALPNILLLAFNLAANKERYFIYMVIGVLEGFKGSGGIVLFAYLADTTTPEQRAKVWGMILAIDLSVAGIACPMLWAYLDEKLGFHRFVVVHAFCHIGPIVLALMIPESNPKAKRASLPPISIRDFNPLQYFRILFVDEERVILSNGRTLSFVFRACFGTIFFLYVAKVGFMRSLGIYAISVYGFTVMQASYLISTYRGAAFLTQFSLFVLVSLFSYRTIAVIGVCSGIFAGLILSIPHVPGIFMYIGEVPLATAGLAFVMCTILISNLVSESRVGEATGVIHAAEYASLTIGPILFGALTEAFAKTSYTQGGFLVLTSIMTLAVVCALFLPTNDVVAARSLEVKMEAEQSSGTKKILIPGASLILSDSGVGVAPSIIEGVSSNDATLVSEEA